jgi:hypothetical protein
MLLEGERVTITTERPTLASLNEGFRSYGETEDFETVREYRVGKWGTRWSRDGYSSRGAGGDKLHVSVVSAITAVKAGYDWARYCAESVHAPSFYGAEKVRAMRARQVAEHGQPWHHCRQPQVGDVMAVNPVCRFENVRGTGAWTPEEVDTDRVDCLNCRRQFFHEEVDGVAERRAERAAVDARKAARPKPARCFWCGDIRPHTKATRAGEQLPCSYCKDNFETIWWVETTGYSNKYFSEFPKPHLAEMAITDENQACDRLERVEGKYFR